MPRATTRLSRRPRRLPPVMAILAAAFPLLAAGAAPAAVGVGSSPPAIIDTVAPVVALDPLPGNLLVRGGEVVTFHWTTADSHPGSSAADFTAEVRDGQASLATIDYLSTYADATWPYTAPEISSGYLHAVVTCRDAFGNTTTAQTAEFSVILSTSPVPGAALPTAAVLAGAQPNPCNPGTMVRFALPAAQRAVLEVYAADGARVRMLAAGDFAAGAHEVYWDGRDDGGRAVASGTYLLRLSAGGAERAAKLSLVR